MNVQLNCPLAKNPIIFLLGVERKNNAMYIANGEIDSNTVGFLCCSAVIERREPLSVGRTISLFIRVLVASRSLRQFFFQQGNSGERGPPGPPGSTVRFRNCTYQHALEVALYIT